MLDITITGEGKITPFDQLQIIPAAELPQQSWWPEGVTPRDVQTSSTALSLLGAVSTAVALGPGIIPAVAAPIWGAWGRMKESEAALAAIRLNLNDPTTELTIVESTIGMGALLIHEVKEAITFPFNPLK